MQIHFELLPAMHFSDIVILVKLSAYILAFFILLLVGFTEQSVSEQADKFNLIPQPRSLNQLGGTISLKGPFTIVDVDENDRFAADLLKKESEFQKFADKANIQIFMGNPKSNAALRKALEGIGQVLPKEIGNEGYLVVIRPKKILIAANSSAGVYYGVQTLIQISQDCKSSGTVPCLKIVDYPSFSSRGFHQDLGREEVPTQEQFKKIIRRLGYFKINIYVLYLEDTFKCSKHPQIGKDRDTITSAEVEELVAFAKKHHVTIVPSFETLGHTERILKIPKYAHLAEDKKKSILNPTLDETYTLLKDFIDEIAKAFKSPIFIIGCDEVVLLGHGAARKQALELGIKKAGKPHEIGSRTIKQMIQDFSQLEKKAKNKNLRNPTEKRRLGAYKKIQILGSGVLYSNHLKRVREIVRPHKARVLFYGDMYHPDFFKAFGIENYPLSDLKELPKEWLVL